MGSCCSCCSSDDNGQSSQELELQQKKQKAALAINKNFSAPEIQYESGIISGSGLALAGAPIEQDAAYWEWHISLRKTVHVDTVLFGVTGKKDREFYKSLQEGELPEEGQRFVAVPLANIADFIRHALKYSSFPHQFFLCVFHISQILQEPLRKLMERSGCEAWILRMEMLLE